MSMHWGMANRLARIIKPDGRAVMLAVDDGLRRYHIASGGLTDLGRALQEQCRGSDFPPLSGSE